MALVLSGCSAGASSRCGYDWVGNLICEERFHHPGKPGTFAMYAVQHGEIIPLYAEESSSIMAPIGAIMGASPF